MWNNESSITLRAYDPWSIRSVEDGYEVFDDHGEVHKVQTYSAAHFLKVQFNDQYDWFTYRRHYNSNSITLSTGTGTVSAYSVTSQPNANVKLFFGDNAEHTNTYFQFYLRKPPNKVQRWFMHKLIGMKMVLL